jgi:hypothetical protein
MTDRVTNQRLFANNNVQYFGNESDYTSNLTDGEINTFADWTPATSYSLKEMKVKVTINEADSLKFGIRSGNLLSDGSRETSNNSGWFKVDHFRIDVDTLFIKINNIDNMLTESPNVFVFNNEEGFVVKVNEEFNHGKIWLYSINGNLILQESIYSSITNVKLSTPGIFVVRVVLDENVTTKKIYHIKSVR